MLDTVVFGVPHAEEPTKNVDELPGCLLWNFLEVAEL